MRTTDLYRWAARAVYLASPQMAADLRAALEYVRACRASGVGLAPERVDRLELLRAALETELAVEAAAARG